MEMFNIGWSVIGLALGAIGLFGVFSALFFRRVVPTNEVHIVQSAGKTTSYGKDTGNGNSYYEWPSWIPVVGVRRTGYTTSVFDIDLDSYEAYDLGRLPFQVDVKAFFRIQDSNVAAQRVSSFAELKEQLLAVVQGAARVVLATNDIETILQSRATLGEQFTKEVSDQLLNWGVTTVKNIELMDIRDSGNSNVIQNIMAKKKSLIETESRTEVAKNKRVAQVAEIEAQREVDMQKAEAVQTVGMRNVEVQRQLALQEEAKVQAVKEQQRTTKEKDMQILQVENTRKAEIIKEVALVQSQQQLATAEFTKNVALVQAAQQRETSVLLAQGQKDSAVLNAEASLEFKKREAEGITLEGTARAESQKAMELAPIQAQITLAREIGANKDYQEYLITIKKVEAQQAIGIAQAASLEKADIKVIANTGSVSSGMDSLGDLFTSKGGSQVGAMLEGLANTEVGGALVKKFTGGNNV